MSAGATICSSLPGSGEKLIGTHDGAFHCDEALACAMLRMTDEFAAATIVRTRKPEILKECNIVVDVGAVYDPPTLRLDHHQPEFQDTMTTPLAQYKTRLSSAGLVYRHYGRQVLQKLAPEVQGADMDTLYDAVYKHFIEHIDGGDNGVPEWSSPSGETLVHNYRTSTALPSRVANLHPRWNEPSTPAVYNERFGQAMQLVETEFREKADYWARAWMPARAIVRRCLETRLDVHESGKIAKLDQFCPWMEHLFEMERELGIEGAILYVLFADVKEGWRVRAVGVEGQSYANRKSLPWKGLRDEELSKASGVPDSVFIHASGFIGGNRTYEGALKLAAKALEM